MGNILEQAHKIVYERSEEKERMYGDFISSMIKATNIYNEISQNKMDVDDMYKAMVAIKLSRQWYSHKEDNLLDAVAYISSMNDYLNNKTQK